MSRISFEPHWIGVEMAGLDARDRLDVGGDAFFDPVVLIVRRRERLGEPFRG